jgi:uncharacterized alkaline shock family protein YloU
MRLFDRIVLAIYTLSLGALSVIFILMSLGWHLPMEVVGTSLSDPQGRLLVGIIALFYLVISARFIYFAFKRKYSGQTVVHETALGEVRVTLDAIENLVKKVARQVQGVREVAGRVYMGPAGIRVALSVVVSPDISIPSVSNEVQTSVKSYVRSVVGVDVSEVSVFVENITAEARRSRVE